jgi:hypothetical protein
VCTRGSDRALLCGPSTSPLEVTCGNRASRRIRNAFAYLRGVRAVADSLVLQVSSLCAAGCACGRCRLRSKSGRAPKRLRSGSSRACGDARQARIGFACGLRGALNSVTMSPVLAALWPHAHSRTGWVTSNPRLERAVRGVVGARFARQMYASRPTRAWRRAAAAQAPR